ncbi:MAG: tetratricopeptide repeat protein [Leptospirales bacterium]
MARRWAEMGFTLIGIIGSLIMTQMALADSGPKPPSAGYRDLSQRIREKIQIDLKLGNFREALFLARRYVADHPRDQRGYVLKARVYRTIGEPGHSLHVIALGLTLFPGDSDLLYLKGSILLEEKKFELARPIFMQLYQKNPNDPGIRSDLLQTFEGTGIIRADQTLSTNFLSGTATQPPVQPSIALLSNLSDWSLSSNVYSLLYPGGTSLVVDTRVTTPVYGQSHFFAGRTEYFGFSQGFGNGMNDFSYAGTDWALGAGTHLLLEAGDTSVRPSPGLYGRFDHQNGPFSFSLQGFGNMVWGDFGESIAQNGVENGMIAQASYQIFPRLGISAEYWYFNYFLENGTLPYGNLHNTEGMFDLNLSRIPHVDMIGGYDSWTVLSPPLISSRVPILLEQRYFMVGLSWEKRYESLWTLTGEAGGYDDTYLHLASYEASAGIAYRLGSRWQFFTNAFYFNQSTVVSGQTESFMGGFQFWF